MDLFKWDFFSVPKQPIAEENNQWVSEEYLKWLHRFLNWWIVRSSENKIIDSTIQDSQVMENMEGYQEKINKLLKQS